MDREQDRIRYLEMLESWQLKRPGTAPHLNEIFDRELDLQEGSYWEGILLSLEEDQLLKTFSGMGGPGAMAGDLTHRGQQRLEEVRRLRNNPAARRKATANQLLHWIDQQDQQGVSWMQVAPAAGRLFFLGDRLSEQELFTAAQRLAEDGLIEGKPVAAEIQGLGLVRMQPLGRRCVESDMPIDEFLRSERRQEPSVQYNLSGQFTGSNIAAGGSNFSQTLTNSESKAEEIKVLLEAVLQALPVLDLEEGQEAAVRRNVEVIQAEIVQDAQDVSIVKGLMKRVAEGVASGAGTALGGALNLLMKFEMSRMGIPIE